MIAPTITDAHLVRPFLVGPDLRRSRYASARDRLVCNVLYYLPWPLAFFGISAVIAAAELPEVTAPGRVLFVGIVSLVAMLLAGAADVIALRRFYLPEAEADEAP